MLVAVVSGENYSLSKQIKTCQNEFAYYRKFKINFIEGKDFQKRVKYYNKLKTCIYRRKQKLVKMNTIRGAQGSYDEPYFSYGEL